MVSAAEHIPTATSKKHSRVPRLIVQGYLGIVTLFFWYALAALGEIAGCFAFWAWLRLHKSGIWVIPGIAALIVFALALTRIDTTNAGRAYAAYGGVYIISSILWLRIVEGVAPDRWDLLGAGISLVGAGVILFGSRS